MECDWFLCRMFVHVTRVALREPDVDHIGDVIDGRIANADIFVENFCELCVLGGEERFAARPVHAGFIELRECNLRSWRYTVFDPKGGALVTDACLRIKLLEHADILLVAIPEMMRVILADRESGLHRLE